MNIPWTFPTFDEVTVVLGIIVLSLHRWICNRLYLSFWFPPTSQWLITLYSLYMHSLSMFTNKNKYTTFYSVWLVKVYMSGCRDGTPLLGQLSFIKYWLGSGGPNTQTFCLCVKRGRSFSGFTSTLCHSCCTRAVQIGPEQKHRKWVSFFPAGIRAQDCVVGRAANKTLFSPSLSWMTVN